MTLATVHPTPPPRMEDEKLCTDMVACPRAVPVPEPYGFDIHDCRHARATYTALGLVFTCARVESA